MNDNALHDLDDDDQPGRDVIIVFAVFFEGGLAPLALVLGWLLGHPPLLNFAFRLADVGLGLAVAAPLVLLFVILMRWPIGPIGRIKTFFDEEVIPLLAGSSWSEIALIAVSAGVGEEMLFRGVLQSAIQDWTGSPWWGVALGSLVFGLLHPISVPYIVVASFLGFVLGMVYVVNGNPLTVMVAHAAYDFAALGYLLHIRPWDGSPVNPIQILDRDESEDDYPPSDDEPPSTEDVGEDQTDQGFSRRIP
jgi:membrane protease YdiL (CAAX protease family)